MAWFSFFGIVVALVVIIVGTLRGHSLILVSTIAALVCAITGAIATVAMQGYAGVYVYRGQE
ncbi:hypothetical protein Desor_1662 [Desulfosporosinus orientis DSM 765]|uniref:Uncharacterized protein n=1 Tax=Desulfosporosinus orientis (strain ATCC 19365 / DSM 765 / NCIMB 8382 / VKM B-1628 / Singapore I) TaxID=768706 RepID=G7WEX6_DESOD|nr:hypothetical protein [Desulfosporosinus orientis]AET67305.1 hypothetical protein Desor_1662 [Desulfosporosinus orientis DSM 765]